jgi:hypothetical protein
MKFASFDKMDTTKPETSPLENQGKKIEQQTESQKLSPAETVDDNGRKYRTEDGGWLAKNKYILDGVEYKTDDSGSVYKCDGKYFPDDWFVLNGNLYVTDSEGEVIGGDIEEDEQVGEPETEQQDAQNLTDEDRARIKEETGWSDEIIDAIESMDQYEVYKNADLHEAEVNGRKCLLKDIDLDQVDPKTGKTNRELMSEGKSPVDSKTGEKIELHHMGQNFDGPFAELCENSEHGDGNHKTLHTSHEGSWRNDPEQKNQYQREKSQHWKTRAQG